MFPNCKDFQIAARCTLGKVLPKHIEEVWAEVIENSDIKYNFPMFAYPLLRTPIYERIVLRILDAMEDLKEICFFDDRTRVVPTGRGRHLLDEYENEMNQRLPFVISRKKFERHTQGELAKAYRKLNGYPDQSFSQD